MNTLHGTLAVAVAAGVAGFVIAAALTAIGVLRTRLWLDRVILVQAVTGLAAGRYVLVHRVNETGALQESRSDNNASSLLIRLSWRDGRPSVAQLRRCPGADACATPS